MFSNGTSPPLFASNRRLERPSRPTQDMNIIKPPRRVESVLVNNLNIAFAGLNPNHPKLRRASPSLPSPTPSARSFQSTQSAYSMYSSSSMSSSSSLGPYNASQPELSSRHRLYDDSEATQRTRTMPGSRRAPTPRTTIPVARTSNREPPTIHVPDARSYTPRPSFDSVSSSDSDHSWLDLKSRKLPPPPLQLDDSNLRPKKHHNPPAIEVLAPGPPRGASRLSSYSLNPTTPPPPTPGTPDVKTPSEEEIRRRRHEKVMQRLGERVPPELVYRGRKIPNVTVFPDPPSSPTDASQDEGTSPKLARRSSFTLLSFPNISTSLRSTTNHGRDKSRDLLDLSESPNASTPTPTATALATTPHSSSTPTPTPLTFPRHHRNPRRDSRRRSAVQIRPESVYSPMTFATALERTPTQSFRSLADAEGEVRGRGVPYPFSVTSEEIEAERAAKLARRASLSTATFLPSSPLRDGFRDLDSGGGTETPPPSLFVEQRKRTSPRRSERFSTVSTDSMGGLIDVVNVTGRSRPESMMIKSPLVFARHISLVPPHPHPQPQPHPQSQPHPHPHLSAYVPPPPSRPGDGFKLLVEDATGGYPEDVGSEYPSDYDDDDDDDSHYGNDGDDSGTTGSRTPPSYERQNQSNVVHVSHSVDSHSDLGPNSRGLRSDAPFQNSGVPLLESYYLAPPSSWRQGGGVGNGIGNGSGKDLVQRKERRQGWSGEWNQGDMQDVIKKLRSLK